MDRSGMTGEQIQTNGRTDRRMKGQKEGERDKREVGWETNFCWKMTNIGRIRKPLRRESKMCTQSNE